MIVLAFPGCADAARRMAKLAGVDCADVDVHAFPDGESLVRLPERLPARTVLYVTLDHPNTKLVELLLAAGAASGLGASALTLVAPYLCYMRQDVAFRPGEAVSQRIVGELLSRHFDTVITVDPHAVPARRAVALTATAAMADWLIARGGEPVLIGPDAESAQWVSAIASRAGVDFGVATKQRLGDRDVRIELPETEVGGRAVVLVDDVASTGQTLVETARRVREAGASSVSVLVTHALFVGDALQRLADAGVDDIVSTDSVPHESNAIELAGLLAGALAG